MAIILASERELLTAARILLALLEANYSYEEIDVKRWVADADACDLCADNEDLGWIEDSEVFEGVFGDVDGPPAHPNCLCDLEYGTKRHRVYD